MRKITPVLLILTFAIPGVVKAQENKPVYKFGGQIEYKTYFDDYRSVASRNDLQYKYPLMPNFNTAGEDINLSRSLNFSIAPSRLTFSVSGIRLLNADLNTYIETDFLGSGESYIGMMNLRHAYFNLQWKRGSLLFGQTDHLTVVKEVSAGVVAFGSGYPFNSLHRGMQVRYTGKLSDKATFLVAAEIYSSHKSMGPATAQVMAGIPDLHAQLKFGDPDKLFGGLTVGYKIFKPRNTDATYNPISTTIGGFDFNAFFKAVMNGYSLKIWGIYGDNLSMYNMIGGYGKISYAGGSSILDFDYTNMRTLSLWTDAETHSFRNLNLGLFYGFQMNMGTKDAVDLQDASNLYFRDHKLEWFTRISPRVVYSLSKKLIFGLEYNLTFAQWAKSVDAYLKPVERYDVNYNNRVEFMAKFVF
jgi:hypothetical protein